VILFTDQLLLLKTHVNAVGFFNVSKHLFPSVGLLVNNYLVQIYF